MLSSSSPCNPPPSTDFVVFDGVSSAVAVVWVDNDVRFCLCFKDCLLLLERLLRRRTLACGLPLSLLVTELSERYRDVRRFNTLSYASRLVRLGKTEMLESSKSASSNSTDSSEEDSPVQSSSSELWLIVFYNQDTPNKYRTKELNFLSHHITLHCSTPTGLWNHEHTHTHTHTPHKSTKIPAAPVNF